MLFRVRPAIFLPLLLAASCGAKWTDVRTAYARFEVREVDDLAEPFARYSQAGSDKGACGGVEFKTEDVPPRSGHRVVYAWAENRKTVEQCVNGLAAPAADIAIMKVAMGFEVNDGYRTYNLGPTRILSGADIVRGRLEEKDGMLSLQIEVTAVAAWRFADFTKSHVGRRLAIVIDGDVEAAPVIAGPINSSRISLSTTERSTGLALLKRLTGT